MAKKPIRVKIIVLIIAIVTIPICVIGLFVGEIYFNMEIVEPQKESGYHWPYITYTPPHSRRLFARGVRRTILVIPNNTGKSTDDYSRHLKSAKKMAIFGKLFFRKLPVTLLVPIFPRSRSDWKLYTHALDRDTLLTSEEKLKRLDHQLLSMVDDFGDSSIRTNDRILMFGFSASGMFVNRFTIMHPERVQAAAIGSPGGWPIAPLSRLGQHTLRYPVGIGDMADIAGISCDIDRFSKVPLLFFLGSKDTNDSVTYTDGYDPIDKDVIFSLFGDTPVDRWMHAEEIYSRIGSNASFLLKDGIGHNPVPFMNEVASFLSRHTQR